MATLQSRRGAASGGASSGSGGQVIPPVTAAHGAAGSRERTRAAASGPVASTVGTQAASAAGGSDGDFADSSAALIERTVSAALAHMPSQGTVWPKDAADDPGWVRGLRSRAVRRTCS